MNDPHDDPNHPVNFSFGSDRGSPPLPPPIGGYVPPFTSVSGAHSAYAAHAAHGAPGMGSKAAERGKSSEASWRSVLKRWVRSAEDRLFGYPLSHPMHSANRAKLRAIWTQHEARRAATEKREMLLEPNRDSMTKIERYVFSVSTRITLGTATNPLEDLGAKPAVTMRPQSFRTNAPCEDFVFIDAIMASNVCASIGDGALDAFTPKSLDLDLPTLSPGNLLSLHARYTGRVPEGFEPERRVYLPPIPIPAARAMKPAKRIRKGKGRGARGKKIETQDAPQGYITIVERKNESKFLFSASFTGPASIS